MVLTQRLILLFLSILISADCLAATNTCMRFPTGTPVSCVDSASGGSGNIGIGTVTNFGGYVGVSTIGPFQTVEVAGNVGIGTSVPSARLDVAGFDSGTTITSASAAMVAISNTNTTNNNFSDVAFCTTTSTGGVTCPSKIAGITTSHTNAAASGDIVFVSQNTGTATEKMRIMSGGNVGIGTSTPGASLVVMGNVGIGTNQPINFPLVVGNVGIATYMRMYNTSDLKTNSEYFGCGWGLISTNVYGCKTDKSGTGTARTFVLYYGGLSSGAVQIPTSLSNPVQIGSSTISSAATLGRLQIGSSGVNNTSTSATSIELNLPGQFNPSSSSTMEGRTIDASPTINYAGGGAGRYVVLYSAPTETALPTGNNAFIDFAPGAVTKFFVSNTGNVGIGTNTVSNSRLAVMNGNVGIGTTTPQAGFVVTNGNVGIGTWTAPSSLIVRSGNIGIGVANTTNSIDTTGAIAAGTYANSIAANTGDLIVSGNIGMGTYAFSQQRLAIKSGVSNPIFTMAGSGLDGSTFQQGDISVNTTTGFLIETPVVGATLYAFRVRSRNGEDDLIYASPNTQRVGISTSSPGSNLSVLNGVSVGSYATNTAPTGGAIISGNVGIGSLTPGSLLDVAGKTRITAGGHNISTGTSPTVASNDCGTTAQGTLVAKSTDNSGSITVGTLAVTACAITFNASWVNAPNCVVIDDSNVLSVKAAASTTKLTVTSTTSMSGDVISYICQGNE